MIVAAMALISFTWDFSFSSLLIAATVIVALFSFARKVAHGREDNFRQQTALHVENKTKLDVLLAFQQAQISFNANRDSEISELKKQTAALAEMAKGFDRRLVMLEDRAAR